MEKQQAVIKNVRFGGGIAYGICVSHPLAGPNYRFDVGDQIHTSRVVSVDHVNGTFETLNTVYKIEQEKA